MAPRQLPVGMWQPHSKWYIALMAQAAPLPFLEFRDPDQRVAMHGMSWWQYEVMLAARGESPVPRMAYCDGVIELMSPGLLHEGTKSVLGMLVEAYCFHQGNYFVPMASTTLKQPAAQKGAEPDESYALSKGREVPDLAIEVIFTSGSIDKLTLYRDLGVGEVWFWIQDKLMGYVLKDGAYQDIDESVALPGLKLATLTRYASMGDAYEAVRAFKRSLVEAG